jgi:hypothetical protein
VKSQSRIADDLRSPLRLVVLDNPGFRDHRVLVFKLVTGRVWERSQRVFGGVVAKKACSSVQWLGYIRVLRGR